MFLLIIGKRVGDFFEFVLLSSLEKHVGYLHPREYAIPVQNLLLPLG